MSGTSVQVSESTEVDETECRDCGTPVPTDDLHDVHDEGVCDDCFESYSSCDDCSDLSHNDDVHSVKSGDHTVCEHCLQAYSYCESCSEYENEGSYLGRYDQWVCEHCLGNNWNYCDNCGEYYHDEDSCCHDEDCDCEAPGQHFALRRVEGHLANDAPLTVSLPSGVISDEGVGQIANLLRRASREYPIDAPERGAMYNLAWQLPDLDSRWQTKEGNYTKRLGKLAYKSLGLKLPPEVITQVGNIAREHSQGVDFEIEVTRNLNLPREEFVHEGSCWWTEYSESRCALKSNGGFGLRTFVEGSWARWDGVKETYRRPQGRAWVMPLRLTENGALAPTFDTEKPDAFVVFNGYGDLEGYAPARIVAQLVGMTYRKIAFTCDPMYVNNEAGYLVASEEIVQKYAENGLGLSVRQHADLFYNETANKREFANA